MVEEEGPVCLYLIWVPVDLKVGIRMILLHAQKLEQNSKRTFDDWVQRTVHCYSSPAT